jgi:hypothetical protein
VITVALDRSNDDVREYISAAAPSHPSLIDSEHRLADLYGIINVPTGVWIDERGRIVRPNFVAFANDAFIDFHGIPSAPHLEALRAWVREGRPAMSDEEVRESQMMPTREEQLARAEFGLAWYLVRNGMPEAAEPHFTRAGELSPDDFTIRRGSMPIRGIDPMGPKFLELYQEWNERGRPYYRPRRA